MLGSALCAGHGAHVSFSRPYQPAPHETSAAADAVDGALVDAHAFAGLTYDYYYKRFGRRGLEGGLAAGQPDVVAQAVALMKSSRTDSPDWPLTGPSPQRLADRQDKAKKKPR